MKNEPIQITPAPANIRLKNVATSKSRGVGTERHNQNSCNRMDDNDKLGAVMGICSFSLKQKKHGFENDILPEDHKRNNNAKVNLFRGMNAEFEEKNEPHA